MCFLCVCIAVVFCLLLVGRVTNIPLTLTLRTLIHATARDGSPRYAMAMHSPSNSTNVRAYFDFFGVNCS